MIKYLFFNGIVMKFIFLFFIFWVSFSEGSLKEIFNKKSSNQTFFANISDSDSEGQIKVLSKLIQNHKAKSPALTHIELYRIMEWALFSDSHQVRNTAKTALESLWSFSSDQQLIHSVLLKGADLSAEALKGVKKMNTPLHPLSQIAVLDMVNDYKGDLKKLLMSVFSQQFPKELSQMFFQVLFDSTRSEETRVKVLEAIERWNHAEFLLNRDFLQNFVTLAVSEETPEPLREKVTKFYAVRSGIKTLSVLSESNLQLLSRSLYSDKQSVVSSGLNLLELFHKIDFSKEMDLEKQAVFVKVLSHRTDTLNPSSEKVLNFLSLIDSVYVISTKDLDSIKNVLLLALKSKNFDLENTALMILERRTGFNDDMEKSLQDFVKDPSQNIRARVSVGKILHPNLSIAIKLAGLGCQKVFSGFRRR